MKFQTRLLKDALLRICIIICSMPLQNHCSFISQENGFYTGILPLHLFEKIHSLSSDNQEKILLCDIGYEQYFKTERIIYNNFGTEKILIQGSTLANRNSSALIADYFGLSPSFSSSVTLKPIRRTWTLSAAFATRISSIFEGLYCYGIIPWSIATSGISLDEITDPESTDIAFPLYNMSTSPSPVMPAYHTFKEAMQQPVATGTLQPLHQGLLDLTRRQTIGAIPMAIGYECLHQHNKKIAFELCTTIPTGTHTQGKTVFEPTALSSAQALIGIRGIFNTEIYANFENSIQLFVSCMLAHECAAKQRRSFDLKKNGLLSRYLTVKEFKNGQATGAIVPLINISTLSCKVKNNVLFQGICLFKIEHRTLACNIGYNGFIKSKDIINLKGSIPEEQYGLKGTQNIYDNSTQKPDNTTASTITITTGNLNDQTSVADSSTQFLKTADLNLASGAAPFLITHSIFFSIGKSYERTAYGSPFWGISGMITFDGMHDKNNYYQIQRNACQWTIHFEGGLQF